MQNAKYQPTNTLKSRGIVFILSIHFLGRETGLEIMFDSRLSEGKVRAFRMVSLFPSMSHSVTIQYLLFSEGPRQGRRIRLLYLLPYTYKGVGKVVNDLGVGVLVNTLP